MLAMHFGDMAGRTVELFCGIVATENENGKLIVMKEGKQILPFEYSSARQSCHKVWELRRANEPSIVDILFASGVFFLGVRYAYILDSMGRKKNRELIGVAGNCGRYVFDGSGNLMAFIPDFYPLFVLDRELLVSFVGVGRNPKVKVYDMRGSLLAMGPKKEAIREARRLKKILEHV
jgi:hypothetical protein